MPGPLSFPRPKGFRPSDLVSEAEFCDGPAFATVTRLSGSALRGIRYERQVHRHFLSLYPPAEGAPLYLPSRWIRFTTSDPRERGKLRYAQPDAYILNWERRLITIIECKLSHTQYAWWGLRRLYEPLLRKIFGSAWNFAVCEVCRYYDPGVAWPEPFSLVRSPTELSANAFGVCLLSSFGMLRESSLATAAVPAFPVGLQEL